jgi:type I restriction enzyme M protein
MAAKESKQGGKEQVVDKVSGRLVAAGPEEVNATQPLLDLLINEAGWDPAQLVTRPQWRVPASPSSKRQWPVDVVIFDDPKNTKDPEHVVIICECKCPDDETGIGQLKVYLDREPHARVGIWFNGVDHAVVYKTKDGYEVAPDGTPIPTPRDPLSPTGQRVLNSASLRSAPSLVPVFRRIRDRLATMDQNVNRDEEILPDISLLLLLKILDEQKHQFKPQAPLHFQIDDSVEKTAQRIRKLLDEEVKRNAQLFGANSRKIAFQIDDDSIYYVVETLQCFRLLSNDTDAVAEAFQVIRGKAYKGEEGQYFTPQSVVKVAIAAIDPNPQDRVIDPACGSGSFLATALAAVIEQLKEHYGANTKSVDTDRRTWSTQMLFAIDKDSVSVRLSKAYLSMLGDGSTHVFKADSIRPSTWGDQIAATIQNGAFDVVVTNPPFGTKLKVEADVGRREGYELSCEWVRTESGWKKTNNYVERDLGLLFLERSIQLLAEGGRMAIVLPDTYLFSDSYGWLVQWLGQFTITHSINVPIEAFEPHCRAKTSVIVLKKATPTKGHRVIGCFCETYGEDKHGRPRFKFVDGVQTDDSDDEMHEAARLMVKEPRAESKLFYRFDQAEAVTAGVLVASFWWRKPYQDALRKFAADYDCDLVSVGDLMEAGELTVGPGHGSPSSHFHGKGTIPYVKVVDIKNWRINENPKYAIPEDVANEFRRNRPLQPFDLLTPTRASKNIGLFSAVMPWQTHVILTREIAVWRVTNKASRIDRWLLLALVSLRVVHEQFRFLVLMQMNREDLGDRFKELMLPIPRKQSVRDKWSKPIAEYFQATNLAREKYSELTKQLDPDLFADRP